MQVSSRWSSKRIDVARGASGRRATGAASDLLSREILEPAGLEIAEARELRPRARRRDADTPDIDITVPVEKDESYVLAVRHPSGALTFHAPNEVASVRRGRTTRPASVRFQIPVRGTPAPGGRRGVASKVFKAILVKVASKVADKALGFLAKEWEKRRWKKKGLREGWLEVDRDTLLSGNLRPADLGNLPAAPKRSLLFIHGTFSNAAGGFGDLAAASSSFFDRIQGLYDGNVYAFNHFTVSKTPEENAKELLAALPAGEHVFDVITHSRGGLVLRLITEHGETLGNEASRFKLGHAVLVASPNDGTPLATPTRWENTIGWLATLLEMFPENPLTTTAEFISEAIVWLAKRIPGAAPGIGSMDSMGETIELVQGSPHPSASDYSALIANFEPSQTLLLKAADIGVDAFFGMRNDLVVPTDGGWDVGDAVLSLIPHERIGQFGKGGNVSSSEDVYHNNFFAQPQSTDFLVAALARKPQTFPPFVFRQARARRALRPLESTTREEAPYVPRRAPEEKAGLPALRGTGATTGADTFMSGSRLDQPQFNLMLLPASRHYKETGEKLPSGVRWEDELLLIATYGNARELERFYRRSSNQKSGPRYEAAKRFEEIIDTHDKITDVVNGKVNAQLPSDDSLLKLGETLFETLFPGNIRRLYDVARSRHMEVSGARKGRFPQLDVVFTSMISWIADKPWEFAFDPVRRTYLATEETHFTRNVVTAVPAQTIEPRSGPLRILVVSAQPVGVGLLSIEEETKVISRGFQELLDAGYAELVVLPRATPDKLHDIVSRDQFDVVHFIGHGEYDRDSQTGTLLFVDKRGGTHLVNDRTLREILCRRSIRLVFLNACETGRGGVVNFNSGVAPALVAGGVPTVIANQYSVLDVSATLFAQRLYWSLARGLSVGAAAREARIAVNYSLSGDAIDWAVPVVFTRRPQEVLCHGPAVEEGVPAEAPVDRYRTLQVVAPRRRRVEEKRELLVAVWDVSYAFPDIEDTLVRMNTVQDVYGFERVDMTLPIGAWHRATDDDGDDVRYLDAPRVAEKLMHVPSELGVNYLMCITDEYLMDEEWLNLYGWATDQDDEGILFFSTAGFVLEPGERSTARAIANEIAGQLAMVRGEIGLHARGPRICPFFENIDRDEELIKQSVKPDARCTRLMKERIPDEAEAILAIFRAFDD